MSTKKLDDGKVFLIIVGFVVFLPIFIAIFGQFFFVLLFLGFIFLNPKDKNSILGKILNEKILEFIKENFKEKVENKQKSGVFSENKKEENFSVFKTEKVKFDEEIIFLEEEKSEKINFENKIFSEKSISKKLEKDIFKKTENNFKQKILDKKSNSVFKNLEKNSIKNVKTPSVFDNYVSVLEIMKK